MMTVYGAFSEEGEYRTYYDLVFTDLGLFIVFLGRMPRIFKRRPPLPRGIERQLLRVYKERFREAYNSKGLNELVRMGRARFVRWSEISYVVIKEVGIPLPPVLRRASGDEKERVLMLALAMGRDMPRFYTSVKIREGIKRALKSIGVELRYS